MPLHGGRAEVLCLTQGPLSEGNYHLVRGTFPLANSDWPAGRFALACRRCHPRAAPRLNSQGSFPSTKVVLPGPTGPRGSRR
eukprot:11507135-Alexandrium_andersonii.AAC.1